MSLPPLPLIDGALFIDNTGWVEGMNTCYRYLEYRGLWMRIPGGDKPSLNFGSAQHLMTELRYSRWQNKPIDETFYEALSGVFTDFFAQHPPPAEDWRNLNWAMAIARKYNEKWSREPFNLLQYEKPIVCPHCNDGIDPLEDALAQCGHLGDDAPPPGICPFCNGTGTREVMVEMPFALPLFTWVGPHMVNRPDMPSEVPIIFTGRIDLPLSEGGQLFVMDHKTLSTFVFKLMSGIYRNFWDAQRRSSQHRGYCWAFQQLTGQQVSGYVVNALRTADPPASVRGEPGRKGSKSPEEWWNESFQRERFLLSQKEIEEWKFNTIDLVEEFFWHYQRGYMPQKTAWCDQYGKCPYYDVCQLDSADRGTLLASGQFVNNEWSPLNQPTQSKM